MVDKKFGRKTEQEGEPGKTDDRKAKIRGVAGMIKPDLKRVILQELKLDDWPIEDELLHCLSNAAELGCRRAN